MNAIAIIVAAPSHAATAAITAAGVAAKAAPARIARASALAVILQILHRTRGSGGVLEGDGWKAIPVTLIGALRGSIDAYHLRPSGLFRIAIRWSGKRKLSVSDGLALSGTALESESRMAIRPPSWDKMLPSGVVAAKTTNLTGFPLSVAIGRFALSFGPGSFETISTEVAQSTSVAQ